MLLDGRVGQSRAVLPNVRRGAALHSERGHSALAAVPTATRGHRRRGLRFTSTTARVAAMTRTRRCGIRSIVCIISFTKVTNPEGPAGDTGSAPTWCTSNSLTEPLPASVHGNISHLTTHAGTGPTYRLRSGTISGGITRLYMYSPAQPRSSTASSSCNKLYMATRDSCLTSARFSLLPRDLQRNNGTLDIRVLLDHNVLQVFFAGDHETRFAFSLIFLDYIV